MAAVGAATRCSTWPGSRSSSGRARTPSRVAAGLDRQRGERRAGARRRHRADPRRTFGIQGALVVTGAILPITALVIWPLVRRLDEGGPAAVRRVELLRQQPLFAPLSLATVEHLAGSMAPVRFEHGDRLIEEGARGDAYYLVDQGEVDGRAGRRVDRATRARDRSRRDRAAPRRSHARRRFGPRPRSRPSAWRETRSSKRSLATLSRARPPRRWPPIISPRTPTSAMTAPRRPGGNPPYTAVMPDAVTTARPPAPEAPAHPYDRPTDPAKRHSTALTDGPDRAAARSMLKAIGFTDEDLAKPLVGVGDDVDRDHALQLQPAPARRARQGRHPCRRRHADGVQHGVRERRRLDGHRGHEGLAGQPRGHRRFDRARRSRAPARRPGLPGGL